MSGLGGLARYFDDVMRTIRRPDLDEIRVQRILEDMPYTADIYAPEALGRAVSSGVQLRGVTPDQFTELAYPLELTGTAKNLVEHYADLLRNKRWTEPTPGIFTQRYLDQQRAKPFLGFDDVPFLEVSTKPGQWRVTGHEGRHRNMALRKLYGADTPQLTRFLKQYDSEKSLGFRIPEQVIPEVETGYFTDLRGTKFYKKGGLMQVHKCGCGK